MVSNLPSHSIAPGIPNDVKLLSVNSSQLYLTWQDPRDPNGVILRYFVTWKKVRNDRGEEVSDSVSKQGATKGNVNSFTIRDLGECAWSLECPS